MNVVLPQGDGRLEVARTEGPFDITAPAAGWLLVESGSGMLTAGDASVDVPARAGVFDEPGWSAMVAEGARLSVTGDLVCTVVWRPGASVTTRLVAPGDVAVETRGEGPTARIVRTYVGEGPIIAGETINPPGGWSSYPPHRHEHEEVYVYRFDPADGFGVQVRYEADGGDDDAAATVVRDGHVERITSGYHPVVASPHASMYYLWALAGESDRLSPSFDPRYA